MKAGAAHLFVCYDEKEIIRNKDGSIVKDENGNDKTKIIHKTVSVHLNPNTIINLIHELKDTLKYMID